MRRSTLRFLVGTSAAVVAGLLSASPVAAHPLGNLSINHLDSLHFESHRIVADAIVDTAEIPTAQAADQVDADGDGTASPSELQRYGAAQCEAYRTTLTLSVDDQPVELTTASTSFAYQPGQAGLQTTRLECQFEARTDFASQRRVAFSNHFAPDRVGWHEIIASGSNDSSIVDSTVPTNSVTNGLTNYPIDLLSSPVDVRDATITIAPGNGTPTETVSTKQSVSTFSRAIGPFSTAVERVNRVFNDLVGRPQLTLGVGLLAIGLALILGASHALLPGHGKTVMAAYIAGRQGSVRDAVLVGATVTATHTGGVLILGLALTVSTSLAGESVLAWLGVISGLIIAGLGAGLVRSARRPSAFANGEHTHRHGFGHGHSHTGHSHGGHAHAAHSHAGPLHGDLVRAGSPLDFAVSGRQALVLATRLDDNGAVALANRPVDTLSFATPRVPVSSAYELTARDEHRHDTDAKKVSRRGLVGMGIAGGLVPSPSALVVLLSAIALGRTIFGVVLVIGYGLGMAGTLTLAGVLLVRVRDRYRERAAAEPGRVRTFAARWTRLAPYCTAALVFVVGLGLTIRSLGSI
jgi:nickel/cobalt transporter (NicO) family protein